MTLVQAQGAVLRQILDATHPLWADGLSPSGYARYNEAQLRTPWGSHRLQRYALLAEDGRLLSSAKRYTLTLQLDGRKVAAVGIGALFTPQDERGNGYAGHLVDRLIGVARDDGAEIAILFSEIGTTFYRRLGFFPVGFRELTLTIAPMQGAPMVLVRSGEDRDIPAVVSLASRMAAPYRFALVPTEDSIRFSLSKKRLLAGFSTPGALAVEFFIVEEGATAAAFAILTTAGEDDVVLEMCGDRDPNGARVGALLQVLRARVPCDTIPSIRGSLPHGWLPPQLTIERSVSSPSVLMLRPMNDRVLIRPLAEQDVLFWHGDLF
jgi:GNAT superfamily N-acetyltransferase